MTTKRLISPLALTGNFPYAQGPQDHIDGLLLPTIVPLNGLETGLPVIGSEIWKGNTARVDFSPGRVLRWVTGGVSGGKPAGTSPQHIIINPPLSRF
jgi:hypothetical protein